MKLTGRVINGRIEVDSEESLPEGAPVEVTIAGVDEPYELTEEEEEELWQANLEIERGEFVTAEELLSDLKSRRQGR